MTETDFASNNPGSPEWEQELTRRLVTLTRDLVLIRSTQHRPKERRRAFNLIQNHLEPLANVVVKSYTCEGFESLVALPPENPNPNVLLCAHLDVIDHPHVDHYASRLEGGRIIGPGAGDMKGALAILMELFSRFHYRHPHASLGLAVTSDEEHGGQKGFGYLFDQIGLRCGVAILPDGGSLSEITVQEKGVLHLHLRARGLAAHAARPWLGRNPLLPLMAQVQRIDNWVSSHRAKPPDEHDHWCITCSPTILRTDNEANNCIPESAEAVLDIRFTPPDTVDSLLEKITGLMDPEVDMRLLMSGDPTHLEPDERFIQITEDVAGTNVRRVKASGGSDARFIAAHGSPVLLTRPLVGNLHALDEWIDVKSMGVYFRVCEAYIRERLGLE